MAKYFNTKHYSVHHKSFTDRFRQTTGHQFHFLSFPLENFFERQRQTNCSYWNRHSICLRVDNCAPFALFFYYQSAVLFTLMSGSIRSLSSFDRQTKLDFFMFMIFLGCKLKEFLIIKLSNYWEVMLLESKSRAWSSSTKGEFDSVDKIEKV